MGGILQGILQPVFGANRPQTQSLRTIIILEPREVQSADRGALAGLAAPMDPGEPGRAPVVRNVPLPSLAPAPAPDRSQWRLNAVEEASIGPRRRAAPALLPCNVLPAATPRPLGPQIGLCSGRYGFGGLPAPGNAVSEGGWPGPMAATLDQWRPPRTSGCWAPAPAFPAPPCFPALHSLHMLLHPGPGSLCKARLGPAFARLGWPQRAAAAARHVVRRGAALAYAALQPLGLSPMVVQRCGGSMSTSAQGRARMAQPVLCPSADHAVATSVVCVAPVPGGAPGRRGGVSCCAPCGLAGQVFEECWTWPARCILAWRTGSCARRSGGASWLACAPRIALLPGGRGC